MLPALPAAPQNNIPLIGCAGWSVPSADAAAFPVNGSHLERYAAVFPAVEVNSSFYRSHRPATWARWRDSTPDSFRFSVKLPRTITHEQRLQASDDLLDQFLGEVRHLDQKLGCLLVQLPPSLGYNPAVAVPFFEGLRARLETPIACEPRHASWFTAAAAELLTRLHIGCVIADPCPVAGAAPAGFAGLAYFRLHGSPLMYRSSYSPAYLEQLAQELAQLVTGGKNTWCIFDNTQEFAAVPNALALLDRVQVIGTAAAAAALGGSAAPAS
jgi:uncharacterized protein YecE (DUF72 family)